MKKQIIFGLAVFVVIVSTAVYGVSGIYEKSSPKDGDIVFQTSMSNQSKAIQLATKSKYSHVGIVFINNGKPYVLEAVQPVRYISLEKWIARGKDRKYVVKRLKNADEVLTLEIIKNMKNAGEKFKGKDYDLYFEWSDNRIYCSELVWKIYERVVGIEVGKLEKLKDFDLSNSIVKQKIKERYGNNIPENEIVISPAAIFESDVLTEVSY